MLILSEHHADIGTRLRVRTLVHLFAFRLGFFLLRLDDLPDPFTFGQFHYWFVRLPLDEGPMPKEIRIENPLVAGQCLKAIFEAEESLASVAGLLLNASIQGPPFISNPVGAIGAARDVLDRLSSPLGSQHPSQIPTELPQDAHLWSYVKRLTPAMFRDIRE